MTPKELIDQINAIPYDGKKENEAREAFIKKFPRADIPSMTQDQYNQKGNYDTFCYNLEYVNELPFGIKGQTNKKFGKGIQHLQGIFNMIDDAETGQATGLQVAHNLKDVSIVVLIKILSIYLPDKFISVGHKETLELLASILGISRQQSDLIELNFKCNAELRRLNPDFNQSAFNMLGNAIWQLLSPTNRSGFYNWLKGKSPGSGASSAYVKCIGVLSLFKKTNLYSSQVNISELSELYEEAKKNQHEKGGTYYGASPSYGKNYYYSAAINSYIDYLTNGQSATSSPASEPEETPIPTDTSDKEYPLNMILYGPPGTGKTYNTIRYAVSIIEGLDVEIFANSDKYKIGKTEYDVKNTFNKLVKKGRISFTTFHQTSSYEDFIEGIKPQPTADQKNVIYTVEPGIFKQMCEKARKDKNEKYVLIIDEINRGNIASIFGELITLIEDDKREGKKNNVPCILPYSKKTFLVPANLYIIGTMNTADRSVEALDAALRRRFDFIEMMPVDEKVTFGQDIFKLINQRLRILKDCDHQIGHSYFIDVDSSETLCTVFRNNIIPLLQEYFYGDIDQIRLVIGDGFFIKEAVSDIFPNNTTDIDIPSEIWRLWDKDKWQECKEDVSIFEEALEILQNGQS